VVSLEAAAGRVGSGFGRASALGASALVVSRAFPFWNRFHFD
jgi:hypothetical protein